MASCDVEGVTVVTVVAEVTVSSSTVLGPNETLSLEVNKFLPCNEDVFPDSSALSSFHCSCVFIAKALLPSFPFSRRQNLSSTQEPRPRFSASAF